jgi:hypothetical protein
MSAPNPGAVPPEQLPSSARVMWAIRADGSVIPVAVDNAGGLVTGSSDLQTTPDLTQVKINNSAMSGDLTLVAATAASKTRVYRMKISVAGATVISIKDGAGTTLEKFNFAGNGGGVVLDSSSRPWYTSTANTAFIINSSAAVQVDGLLEYTLAA